MITSAEKNRIVRSLRETEKNTHLNLQIVCEKIVKWTGNRVFSYNDPKQIEFWNNQSEIPSKRRVLLEDGNSISYHSSQKGGVSQEIKEQRKIEGYKKQSEIKKGMNGCKHGCILEGVAIKAFKKLIENELPEILT